MNKKQEESIDRNWHPEFQKYTEAIVLKCTPKVRHKTFGVHYV